MDRRSVRRELSAFHVCWFQQRVQAAIRGVPATEHPVPFAFVGSDTRTRHGRQLIAPPYPFP